MYEDLLRLQIKFLKERVEFLERLFYRTIEPSAYAADFAITLFNEHMAARIETEGPSSW